MTSLIEDLINGNFPIQENKLLMSLIPTNLSFEESTKQQKYLTGIEQIKTSYNSTT